MIIGIEGTGSQGWTQFELRQSFVRRILAQSQDPEKYYLIGPNTAGSDGYKIVNAAWKTMTGGSFRSIATSRLVLLGYSRGAAYCLLLCKKAADVGHSNITLILFDAVARQGDMDIPDKVPASVGFCVHVMRDPRSGSRYAFSNVARHAAAGTTYRNKLVYGTHSAMGGIPWGEGEATWTQKAGNSTMNAINAAMNLSGRTVGLGGPSDRQHLNVSRQAIATHEDDRKAVEEIGCFVWQELKGAKVLPAGANYKNCAPVFQGSLVAGAINKVPK